MNAQLPKVLVVGDQRFADILATCGAQWQVQPAAPTVAAMWDAVEAGRLDSTVTVAIFTDGTAGAPDELEMALAAFAPYATTFIVADPARGPIIAGRTQQVAAAQEGADPNAPLYLLPVTDLGQALGILQQVLAGKVAWGAPGAAPAAAPAPAAPAPQAAFAAAAYEPMPAEAPSPAAAPPPAMAGYDQAGVYTSAVSEALSAGYQKPADARPGQMTISSMSSKGGSGKSTTAIMLAATIARASAAAGTPKKVVIVDLDTRDGQVGSLIGQYVPTAINIRVMPRWDAATVTGNLVHDKRLGIDALLAPVRPRNADDVGPDFYRQIISVLQTTHDVVILDCSVNYLDPLLGTAFAMSDEILFVTTLATTSVQGMARSLTELFADPVDGGLGIPREKVGIVANQVINNVGMGKDKLLRAALGAPLVGQIPSDQDAVLVATNSNRMFDLLKHPKLGPAYFRLAVNCLPNIAMAPIVAEAIADQAPASAPAQEQKRGGIFRK